MRTGRDVEKPQSRNTDNAAKKVDMKITFVTTVRSQRAERNITPGTEKSQRTETVRDPRNGETPRVRA
jgi:hypothetical protein